MKIEFCLMRANNPQHLSKLTMVCALSVDKAHALSVSQFDQVLRRYNTHVVGAFDQKTSALCGYLVYEVAKPGFIRISSVVVHPAYRRRGVGTRLLDTVTRNLHTHTCVSYVTALVDEKNEDGWQFLRGYANKTKKIAMKSSLVRSNDETGDDSYLFTFRKEESKCVSQSLTS